MRARNILAGLWPSALALGLGLTVAACDKGAALKFTGCALGDERLSFAVRSPEKARAYLDNLVGRLEDGEPDAAKDAADLAKRLRVCLE